MRNDDSSMAACSRSRIVRGVAASVAAALLCAGVAMTPARAQDFFSALFGALAPPRAIRPPPPSAADRPPVELRPQVNATAVTYCVRTCDGFSFPIATAEGESDAALCHSFCPAAETMLFRGSSMDDAASKSGRPYAELPNAFRYRKELVAGCTCNGKDVFGLARIDIADDPTLRKGDIVVGKQGPMVASGRDEDGRIAKFSPASPALRAKLRRVPIVASE